MGDDGICGSKIDADWYQCSSLSSAVHPGYDSAIQIPRKGHGMENRRANPDGHPPPI